MIVQNVMSGNVTTLIYLKCFCSFHFVFYLNIRTTDLQSMLVRKMLKEYMRRGVLNKPEEFNVTIQPFFLMDKKCREFISIDHI